MIVEMLEDHLVSVIGTACVTIMIVVIGNTISANLHEPFLTEMLLSFAIIAFGYILLIMWIKIKG